ncbi:MAG: 16S rRNA (cytosine(1402)-N(4))-methyltransferase [Myxococcales bacterium]|nr:16S rRNA (cytosine(1402)-N(4))-methyltransferase [Myxococcales bacterium]
MSGAARPAHIPVLLHESIDLLSPERGGLFVDCTMGAGGHSMALLQRLPEGAELLCLDRDGRAHEAAQRAPWADDRRVRLVRAAFGDLLEVLGDRCGQVTGLLADLGPSSMQLDEEGRGFSFQRDEPLKMVMDGDQEADAATWLNEVSEAELADVLYQLGEERQARRVAGAIARARPLERTGELAEVICRSLNRWPRPGKKHPATQCFMAIRMAVNDEMGQLDRLMAGLETALAPGGIAGLISFHGLEHRRVRRWVRKVCTDDYGPKELARRQPLVPASFDNLTRRGLRPSPEEVDRNPRSRSAQLRGVRRRG